ncbi:MAG TPA: S41 family peptidase [Actinospica sp.]|jgi:tricorn protease|nr:S41 family peptidase [Actinospica sp.]
MAEDVPGYLRFPHVRGSLLTFAAEDDVWLAPLRDDGSVGRAWRVTSDRIRVSNPRLSPDGSTLAWTSWLSPSPEAWTVSTSGGPAQRLSWSGSEDTRVLGWMPNGDVLAVSSYHQPFSRYTWAYSLPTNGAVPARLPWGPVSDAAITLRHTLLLSGTPPHEPAGWKRYRGGATGRLWLNGTRLLEGIGGHLANPMLIGDWPDTRVAFLCDHEGIANVYSCRHDGSDLRRHTDHDTFYARNASTDGRRVVYQHAGDLWLLDSLDAPAPRKLDVPLGGACTGRRAYQIPASFNLNGFACDHDGRASAVLVRGSLYWLTHHDGPARVLADSPSVRVRMPVMLGTEHVAWVSDAEGDDELAIAPLPGGAHNFAELGFPKPRVLAAGAIGRVVALEASPDGSRLAVATSDGRLLLVDAGTGAVREVVRSSYGPVSGLGFSPDSAWLAWSQAVANKSLRRIRLVDCGQTDRIYDVTTGRFEDEGPCFTSDGRFLVFLSWRGFDPVHDVHTGDMAFPLGCRPYLVPLAADDLAPFSTPVEGRAPDGTASYSPPPDGAMRVDPQDLAERLVPFPVIASKYSDPAAVTGGVVWLRWPISGALGQTFANPDDLSGQPALEYYSLDRGECEVLAEDVDGFAVSGDGSTIVLLADGELRLLSVEDPDSDFAVDLRRITHTVHPAEEWRQAYREAARVVRDQYWDPNMCGLDWTALTEQYAPLIERVGSPDDFGDVLQELLGELGTSHAYVVPARLAEGPTRPERPLGLLAMDVHREGNDRAATWVIDRVLAGESSDPRARAPLAAHGVKPGDEIVEIAGRVPDPVRGPLPLLGGTGGTTIELVLRSGADGRLRRIAVTPLSDEMPVRYQDTVLNRRAQVRQLSDGRCGYLHIPDLNGSGWAQFNRDLRREFNYPALVLDVRGNAGGNVSQLVLDKLSRRVLAWDFTRDRRPARYPRDSVRGPVVAIADEATSSDGDVIVAAFRALGLGPVVGQRTWGGVVGMTGRHTLVDGTQITVPKNAAWFPGLGFSIENHGVEPDVEVVRGPLDWAEGRNTQLHAAVRLALELLETHPAAAEPPISTPRPDRRRPPLPPR